MTIVFNHVNICLSWFFFCSRFEVTANLARIHSYGERSNLLEVFGRRFWHRSCPLGQLAQRWRWWTRWTRWTLHWMCQGPTWRCASRLLLKHVETGRWRLSGLPKHWLSNCGRWKSFFSVFQVFHLSLRGELVPVNVWKQRSSRDVYTGNEKKTDQAVTLQLHSCGMLRYFMGFPWFPMVSHVLDQAIWMWLEVSLFADMMDTERIYLMKLGVQIHKPQPNMPTFRTFEMPNSAITTFITSPDCSPLKNAGGFGGANHHFLRRFNQDSNLGRSRSCRLMVNLGASLVWFSMAAVNFRDLWAVFSGVSLAIIVHHEVTKVLIMMSGIVCVSCSDHYYNIHSYYYFFN